MEPIEVPYAPTSEQIRSELNNGIFLLLAALGIALLFGFAAVYTVVDHARFMQDAEPDTGVVQSIEQKMRSGRRGRTTIDYYAIVEGSHGIVRISVDDPLPVGSMVGYLYSPSMKSARIPGNNLLYMGIAGLIFGGVIWMCGWRSYKFLRSWYRFSNGYFVVGRHATDGIQGSTVSMGSKVLAPR